MWWPLSINMVSVFLASSAIERVLSTVDMTECSQWHTGSIVNAFPSRKSSCSISRQTTSRSDNADVRMKRRVSDPGWSFILCAVRPVWCFYEPLVYSCMQVYEDTRQLMSCEALVKRHSPPRTRLSLTQKHTGSFLVRMIQFSMHSYNECSFSHDHLHRLP